MRLTNRCTPPTRIESFAALLAAGALVAAGAAPGLAALGAPVAGAQLATSVAPAVSSTKRRRFSKPRPPGNSKAFMPVPFHHVGNGCVRPRRQYCLMPVTPSPQPSPKGRGSRTDSPLPLGTRAYSPLPRGGGVGVRARHHSSLSTRSMSCAEMGHGRADAHLLLGGGRIAAAQGADYSVDDHGRDAGHVADSDGAQRVGR